MIFGPQTTEFAILSFEGPDLYSQAGGLGVRVKGPTRTATTGADHNTGGLALWFTRAERYELVAGTPYRSVEKRAAEFSLVNGTLAVE